MKFKLFQSKSDFDSIIKPILFLLIGIILFLNPKGIITITLYAFAVIMFVVGIFKIVMHYVRPFDKKDLLTGLIDIIVGLVVAGFTYFAFDAVQIIFRFTIAALLIYTSVMRIVKAFKQPKNIRLIYFITSLVLILLAIVLMVFDLHITTTGLFIAIFAVVEIVGYILNSKYLEENSKIPEANVVGEKIEQNKAIETVSNEQPSIEQKEE